MTEHDELLSEMETIERLSTQERLKHAKRRRALQLKRWSDIDRDSLNKQAQIANRTATIRFPDHVMLLEAVMRKDFDEGWLTFIGVGWPRQDQQDFEEKSKSSCFLLFQVKRLLETGIDPNLANEDGLTSIHQVSL
jgi:protein phosphatase 1 regulatory subunit 16A